MKNLFFVRHANAVNSNNNDFERALTDEGVLKCYNMAETLKPYFKDIDLILSSSAVRTKQTIENIIKNIGGYNKEIHYSKALYNASENELLKHLYDIEHQFKLSPNNVILVNHNPTISYLASFLAAESISSPHHLELLSGFNPGSIALFQANIDSWEELSPDKVHLKNFWR